VLYILIMVFMFILIPFAYFYYEADDEDATLKTRILGGCKYTSFLIVIFVVLLIIGGLLKSHKPDTDFNIEDKKSIEIWVTALFDNNPNAFVVTFGLSCLTTVGFLVLLTYTVSVCVRMCARV
jgi:LMBR1 domain-containing protein 1